MNSDQSPCMLIKKMTPEEYYKSLTGLRPFFNDLDEFDGKPIHFVCGSVMSAFYFESNDEHYQVITTTKDGIVFYETAKLVPMEQLLAIIMSLEKEF